MKTKLSCSVLLLALGLVTAPAAVVTQSISDFAKGEGNNTVVGTTGLRLGDDTTPTTFQTTYKVYGVFTSSPGSVAAFDTLRVNYSAALPAGTALKFSFRTMSPAGIWSGWQEVSKAELTKAFSVPGAVMWQYRLMLFGSSAAISPVVRSVTVQTSASKHIANAMKVSAEAAIAKAAPTYTIYATREGLVGYKTANGHVITSHDHFVALPSGTVLNCNGCSTYTVTLYYPRTGRNVTERVYDVGPWNTRDNYWHSPRAEFTDLAIGLPEAQAAYLNGYNGGKDESGRTVTNPAGIDLADGTFWDSLGMTGNDYVQVTFNWETPPPTGYIVDNSNSGFTCSANWSTGTSASNKYGSNYRYRSTAPVSDQATWTVNLPKSGNTSVYVWYPNGSNRSSTAPFVVNYSGGSQTIYVNEQLNGGKWNLLGTWYMNAGANTVKLSCWTTTNFIVVADAVKWTQ